MPVRWLALVVLAGCGTSDHVDPDAWVWQLPDGVPVPHVPDDNPMTRAKVELGRALFYDKRLSGNSSQACASCHHQPKGFAGESPTEHGSNGDPGKRNSPSLANVAWNSVQTWANPALVTLEQQTVVPMFGETPIELGLAGMEDVLLARLDAAYAPQFVEVFGELSIANVAKAIASFDRSLVSFGSAYDRGALSDAALRGQALFTSDRLACSQCHAGFNFTVATEAPQYVNNAQYDVDGAGAYPARDRGLYDITGVPADMGKFRPPSLRNVAVSGPYMHDGSAPNLDAVLDAYMRGGRLNDSGDAANSPLKDPRIHGFTLTADERADLLAFLGSLTDDAFLVDPAFAAP